MLLVVGKKCCVLYLKRIFKHLLAQQRKLTKCVGEHRWLISWNFQRGGNRTPCCRAPPVVTSTKANNQDTVCHSRGLGTSIADNEKNRHCAVYVTGQTHSHAAFRFLPVLLNRLQILMVSSQHLITSKRTP